MFFRKTPSFSFLRPFRPDVPGKELFLVEQGDKGKKKICFSWNKEAEKRAREKRIQGEASGFQNTPEALPVLFLFVSRGTEVKARGVKRAAWEGLPGRVA